MSYEPRTSEKVSKPRGSMRAAINQFCRDCIYDKTQKGTWRQQVEACTATKCALYSFRPVSSTEEESTADAA